MNRWLLLLLLALALPLQAGELRVVATFTIIADMTRAIAGDRADVVSLVGPDGDAHGFQPNPDHARQVSRADLIVRNGLGFEGWMDRLLDAAGGASRMVTASDGVRLPKADDHHHDHHGHDHGDTDPHAWLDADRARYYVRNIRDGLKAVDPDHAAEYERRTEAYLEALAELDRHIRDTIAAIPDERRRVMTSHAAFGYFEEAYGVTFLSPRGLSTEHEPSAADVAELVRAVRARRVTALLPDNLSDDRLLQRIAAEGDIPLGGTLYSDALSGPDGAAPSYPEMMRHNTCVLRNALTPE